MSKNNTTQKPTDVAYDFTSVKASIEVKDSFKAGPLKQNKVSSVSKAEQIIERQKFAAEQANNFLSQFPIIILALLKLFPKALKGITMIGLQADGTIAATINFSVLGISFHIDIRLEVASNDTLALCKSEPFAELTSKEDGFTSVKAMITTFVEKWKTNKNFTSEAVATAQKLDTIVRSSATREFRLIA